MLRLYASQTKILEDRTKDRSCLFEALFKGVSTGFGLLLVEKCSENTTAGRFGLETNACGPMMRRIWSDAEWFVRKIVRVLNGCIGSDGMRCTL